MAAHSDVRVQYAGMDGKIYQRLTIIGGHIINISIRCYIWMPFIKHINLAISIILLTQQMTRYEFRSSEECLDSISPPLRDPTFIHYIP
jgi:hypothetical protein